MDKLLFIYNPNAGMGRARTNLNRIITSFTKAGRLVTVYPTQGPGDAAKAVKELAAKYDRLAVCGGDGTLHEAVNGLMALPPEKRPAVGYIPAGTTNDFAQNLSLPKKMEDMAALAVTGEAKAVDIGRLGEDYFVYVAAFGAFTDVAYSTPQEFKNALGHLAYILMGVSELASLTSHHLVIEHDGERLEGDFLYGMVSNTVSVGGMLGLPAEEVALDDGLLEALFVPMPKSVTELNAMVVGLATQSYTEESGILAFHTAGLTITSDDPLSFTADGEFGGEYTRADIRAEHKAVQIIHGA